MDALTTLPIKKHTALLNRFPETRFVTQLAKNVPVGLCLDIT